MATRKGKKGQRQRDGLPRRLFKRERGLTIPAGSQFVHAPAGLQKMSEGLEEFVAPYREMAANEDEFRALLNLGILAWNAALLPEDQRRAMIDDVVRTAFAGAPRAERAEGKALVEALVRRKLEHFAANQRTIVSFELTDTGKEFHLFVAATV